MTTSKSGRRAPQNAVGEQQQRLNPGDEAPPGTPGTGETVCPACNGTGSIRAAACPNCGGSGRIIKAIGGA